MRRLGQVTLGVMIAVSAGVVTPMRVAAQSYPIDCAILLCLAGGFPTSVECTAARIEMIRRVTPWPVEPPLQLWNCPLRASGLPSLPNMGSDGLTDEIRGYRDGIEVYHVNYRGQRNSEGIEISDSTQRGFYDEAGEFRWISIRLEDTPLWVRDRVGYHGGEKAGTRRGIAMRTIDYSGQISEVIWETY